MAFTTSFTPRFTCRCLEAERDSSGQDIDVRETIREACVPFLIILCTFFNSFFCANGFAMGDKSARSTMTSSFSLSFFAFFDGYPKVNRLMTRACKSTYSSSVRYIRVHAHHRNVPRLAVLTNVFQLPLFLLLRLVLCHLFVVFRVGVVRSTAQRVFGFSGPRTTVAKFSSQSLQHRHR